jgi:hypothetical protein
LQAFTDRIKLWKFSGILADPGVPHCTSLVYNKCGSFRHASEAKKVLIERTVGSGNFFVEVTQQGEIVSFFGGPCIEGEGAIYADSHNLGILVLQGVNIVSHGAKLFRSPASKGERNKQEHDVLLSLQVTQFEVLHLVCL